MLVVERAEQVGERVLLAANAAGAILGVVLLEIAAILQPTVRTALFLAGLWAISMALFPMTESYQAAVAMLVLAGAFGIAFTSLAQTLVQVLAPANLRGTLVGVFNTAMLGLRAGSGLTIGVLGAFIGVRRSLEISALAVLAIAVVLFVRDARNGRTAALTPERGSV